MKLNDQAAKYLAIFVLPVFTLSFIIVPLLSYYWNANQIRMIYQTVYQKNMECRIANSTVKGGVVSSEFVDKVCGKIPTWEDYQK